MFHVASGSGPWLLGGLQYWDVGMVWPYTLLMNIHFCTVGAFCFGLGFLGFVCMLITFFLGIPSLHRLCQDYALLFSFWFEFNAPTWQQFQLNSISFSSEQYNVSCSKQNFRDGERLVTRENPQTGKIQWKVTCDHTILISNPRTSGYWQTKEYIFPSEEQKFPANLHKTQFGREKSLSSSILPKKSSLKGLSPSMHPEKRIRFCVTVASSKS